MFPQNYSLLGLSILEELGNKQTDKLTGIPLCFIYTIDKSQYPSGRIRIFLGVY